MSKINIAGVIVVIIILILLYTILQNKLLDNFIVFVDDVIIPKSCWEYLVTNGKEFFLFNSKMLVDGVKNPLKFKTKKLALDYLVKSKCPINIPYVDLAINKKLDDPTISFQRYCNHKIAPNVFDVQICSDYGIDNNTLKGKHITDVNEIRNDIKNDKKVYTNYDTETCMIDRVINDDPSLDDTNFKTNFQQYFDRLNTHIDERFLYLTA